MSGQDHIREVRALAQMRPSSSSEAGRFALCPIGVKDHAETRRLIRSSRRERPGHFFERHARTQQPQWFPVLPGPCETPTMKGDAVSTGLHNAQGDPDVIDKARCQRVPPAVERAARDWWAEQQSAGTH